MDALAYTSTHSLTLFFLSLSLFHFSLQALDHALLVCVCLVQEMFEFIPTWFALGLVLFLLFFMCLKQHKIFKLSTGLKQEIGENGSG
jgi:hypothetical protein